MNSASTAGSMLNSRSGSAWGCLPGHSQRGRHFGFGSVSGVYPGISKHRSDNCAAGSVRPDSNSGRGTHDCLYAHYDGQPVTPSEWEDTSLPAGDPDSKW